MTPKAKLPSADFERLRVLDTCTVSNAIERFNVRLRNEGFVSGTARCQLPHLPPMLGYAVTGRIQTYSPPMRDGFYYDNMDWWNYVISIPEPWVIVMQDVDRAPGFGSLMGGLHAAIGLAVNCVGYVTNGAVRDLAAVESMGFHLFAGSVVVSHAYAHIMDFGDPVEIGGLKIMPGDLIQGDRHGVQTIPLAIASEIPQMVSKALSAEREIIEFCRSSGFSLPELTERLR